MLFATIADVIGGAGRLTIAFAGFGTGLWYMVAFD